MAVDLTYPTNLNRFRTRRNESTYLYPLMTLLPSKVEGFSGVESLLCVGPGPGEYELELIERCLPNLKLFVGVENDDYCSNELTKNLTERFGDRFEWRVCRESLEEWQSPQRFDLVMVSHCLYNIEKQQRLQFFGKIFNQWLTPTGKVLLVHMSNKLDEAGRSLNVMQNIHSLLKDRMGRLLEAEEVLQEAQEMGGLVTFAQRYECQMELGDFDDDITFIFNISAVPPLDSATMRRTIQQLKLSNGVGQYFAKLAILCKK